jgi:hypothetical protein
VKYRLKRDRGSMMGRKKPSRKVLPERPLLPVSGRYGLHLPPAASGIGEPPDGMVGPYYGEQQQSLLGIDQYGRVVDHIKRSLTCYNGEGTMKKQQTKGKQVKSVEKKKAGAKAMPTFEEAVAQTEANGKLWEDVQAGRKPRSALRYEDEGGEFKRVGYPSGYTPPAKTATVKLTRKERRLMRRTGQLEAGQTEITVPVEERPKRGRPNGAVTRGNGAFTPDSKITLLVKENPKKEGTNAFEKWKMYKNGMTVKEYYEKGGKTSTLKWDSERELIKIG